jgi:hypothetical protein
MTAAREEMLMIVRPRLVPYAFRLGLALLAVLSVASAAWSQDAQGGSPQPASAAGQPPGPTPQRSLAEWLESARRAQGLAYVERLPPEAQAFVDRFQESAARIRQEAEAQIAAEREVLLANLQKSQEAEALAGNLDGAMTIRNRIRSMQTGARSATP